MQEVRPPTLTMGIGRLSYPPSVDIVDLMLTVSVDKRNGETCLEYTLQERGNPGWKFQPVTIRGELASYAAYIYEGLNRLAQGQDPKVGIMGEESLSPEKMTRQMKTIGRRLWDECFPHDFRALYAQKRRLWHDKTLMIVSDDPYLPWEVVLPYDADWEDGEPWCLTYQLTRWLRRDTQGNGNEGPPGELPWHTLAALAPTDSALPYASPEVAYLKAITATRHLQFIEPLPLTWERALDFFESAAYNWVHMVGHGKHWQINNFRSYAVEGKSRKIER